MAMYQGKNFMQANKRERKIKVIHEGMERASNFEKGYFELQKATKTAGYRYPNVFSAFQTKHIHYFLKEGMRRNIIRMKCSD